MTVYVDTVGYPPADISKNAVMVARLSSHFQSGTVTQLIYSDDPEGDAKKIQGYKDRAKGANSKDVPIWV